MNIKKYVSHQITRIQKNTKKAGRKIIRVPRSVGKLPTRANDAIEQAIERTIRRVQTDIEKRAHVIIADVKVQVLKELEQRQSGFILMMSAIIFAVLGTIMFCFGFVYLIETLFGFSTGISYIIVGALFATISATLLVIARRYLVG